MELVDETNGELPPELEEWMKEIGDNEAEKVENYYWLYKSLESEATVATAEAEQFAAKARARTNLAKNLKDRLKLYLEMTGRKEIVGTSGRKAAIQANGGKVAMTQAYAANPSDMTAAEIERCPESLIRPRVALDTDALRKGLESGEVYDLAKLEPRGTHLRFK